MLNRSARRFFDVVVATIALLVLSPLMLLIAAAILVESGRPIFFAQTRLGHGGREFRIYKFRKFRKLRARDDGDAQLLLTVRGDPRMSRLGRLLERSKLDELPQFYNVVRGDMALVGWRPDTEIGYQSLMREYPDLLEHRPGIFGPAQVAFRHAAALYPPHVHPHEYYRDVILPMKARLDLAYYPRRTLAGDVAWVVRGVLAVIGLHPTLRELPAVQLAQRSQAKARLRQPLVQASAAFARDIAVPRGSAQENSAG